MPTLLASSSCWYSPEDSLFIQMVTDWRRRLGEQRAWVDRERELIAIHRDTAEREWEAAMRSTISFAHIDKCSPKKQ